MDKNVCCVLNYAPHYRAEIYTLLEKECHCSFYFGNETLAKNLKKMDYSLFKNPPVELKFIRLFGNLNWLKGSVKLSLSNKFNAFILTGEANCVSSWLILIFCRILNKPAYVWSHGFYGREHGPMKWLKKIYFHLPDGVFLYNDFSRNIMIKEGFNSKNLWVVYNSLSYKKQLAIRSKLTFNKVTSNLFGNDLPTTLYIGRVTIKKKIYLLIDALRISLAKKNPGFNILIIGDGADLNNVRQYVEKNELSGYVHFFGSCYDEFLLAEHIYNSDLCVSPGEIGLNAIHSLGYGTPVISHNNFCFQGPEFEAIEEGKNGAFFKENDVHSLEEAITAWLKKFPVKTPELINTCFEVIDTKFNPNFQLKVIRERLLATGKSHF